MNGPRAPRASRQRRSAMAETARGLGYDVADMPPIEIPPCDGAEIVLRLVALDGIRSDMRGTYPPRRDIERPIIRREPIADEYPVRRYEYDGPDHSSAVLGYRMEKSDRGLGLYYKRPTVT